MKAVREQIRDTGQVGGSNEFPKVGAPSTVPETVSVTKTVGRHIAELPPLDITDSDRKRADELGAMSAIASGYPLCARKYIACRERQLRSAQQHIANLESELQIARDLIEQMRQQVEHFAKEAAEERRNGLRMRDEGNARIAELQQQLSAANLGSSMQHERYGSY